MSNGVAKNILQSFKADVR